MKMSKSWDIIQHTRVRFPPFESSLMVPEHLPIAERHLTLHTNITDLSSVEEIVLPPVKFGQEDSWLIERKFVIRDGDGNEQKWLPVGGDDSRPFPPIVERQRQGWYLTPSPIHRLSRKVVTIAVIILLSALTYQFIEPLFIWAGVLSQPLVGSIRVGLLDYPFLMLFVLPWMILPLVMRIGANIRDLRRQKSFLNNPPAGPEISFSNQVISDEELLIQLSLPQVQENWLDLDVFVQVGLLPPARETLLEALSRNENQQPPPGMSTPLPHYWEKGLSDGTGIGEETPLERQGVSGGMFLRPMRIRQKSESYSLSLNGGDLQITLPKGWPGTQAGSFVRIHWELILQINRISHGPLLWVLPLRVASGSGPFEMPTLNVNDGRSEESIN
jgi:hypothetical protein